MLHYLPVYKGEAGCQAYDVSRTIQRGASTNMIRIITSFVFLILIMASAHALGKKEVRQIVEAAYPGAVITEIEKERYQGRKVFEVDFKHDGEALEAIIDLDGEIVKVQVDD